MDSEIDRYFVTLESKLRGLAADNKDALNRAADLCAESLAQKQVVQIYDTGHLISYEMIARTGGLVAYTRLSFDGALTNSNLWRAAQPAAGSTPAEQLKYEQALQDWVFAQNTLRKGDVLVIGSVSGVSIRVVELAIQARQRGLSVIAVTAPSFSSRLSSKHPSGKRLHDIADVVLDNNAEYGDAFFSVAGSEQKVVPISGMAAAALMWAMTVGIVERLCARGLPPTIYESINLPGGSTRVAEIEKQYQERGI